MKSLLESLKNKRILISDGAWGTLLIERGLKPGECPELWNITHRPDVFAVAKSYIDAGADMILTNSFGASPAKLLHYGLENRTEELNQAAADISREAAGDNHFVLGSIGPTGVILMMGDVPEQKLFEGFCIQAEGLKKGGVDAVCIETMSALDEACLAVKAVKSVTNLEVVCTFTFEKTVNGTFRTMMGVSPSDIVEVLKDAGASVIGANCGNGFDQMIEIVREIRTVDSNIPVLVHANAGKPVFTGGKTVFPESPAVMAEKAWELVNSGANIIGGCCGTTPAHISALVHALKINH
ncbi:MAG: homocysteine S-methyltransferase family protein [Ignavibacteriaceae bacterium]